MIYNEDFKKFLEQNLGPVKDRPKNFICRCPWCEWNAKKAHYHLWISKDAPIFHCFHCEHGGVLNKLLQKVAGTDTSEKYVDKEAIKKVSKEAQKTEEVKKKIQLPGIDEATFHLKSLFMKKRLGYTNIPLSSIKGLIFDANKFWEMNNIPITPDLFRMKDFLQANFVGFLTENESKIIFRNIDLEADFRYYKHQLRETEFLDYYRLVGGGYLSTDVILAEGIFDILSEHTFDNLGLKQTTKVYAAALSKSYETLIKSIIFNEQIFRLNVHILSDRDVDVNWYKTLRKRNGHLIDTLTVWYNKTGKDFNVTPVIAEKIIIKD